MSNILEFLYKNGILEIIFIFVNLATKFAKADIPTYVQNNPSNASVFVNCSVTGRYKCLI